MNFCFVDSEMSDVRWWHYTYGGLVAHTPPPHSTGVKPGSALAPPSLSHSLPWLLPGLFLTAFPLLPAAWQFFAFSQVLSDRGTGTAGAGSAVEPNGSSQSCPGLFPQQLPWQSWAPTPCNETEGSLNLALGMAGKHV